MPLSDDEYDSGSGFTSEQGTAPTMSKAELRKTNKPIMEKKRRARINHCLNELKDLLLDAMNKDPARHSKLEKADILELAVKHLQAVQRQQLAAAVACDPAVLQRFRSGFGDCAGEVRRYLSRLAPATPAGLRTRLSDHLDTCISSINRVAPDDFRIDERLRLKIDRPELDERAGLRAHEKQSVFQPFRTEKIFDRHGLKMSQVEGRTEVKFEDRRRSAFRYVRRPVSPPLSPISCDSACDSSTEPETPPRAALAPPHATYPTPPSRSASDQDSSPETQKPTVSSTTISPESRLQPLDLKTKKLEPISIVIDVDNYKIGIDASPKRPIDYRHKLKRTHSYIAPQVAESKVARLEVPIEPVQLIEVKNTKNTVESDPKVKTVISHTAESLATSSVRKKPDEEQEKKDEQNKEADTSGSPEQKAHGSGDTMWRPW